MHRAALLCIVALAIVPGNFAKAEWKGKGEAGAVFARGNTETNSFNMKLEGASEINLWKHALDMSGLRSSNQGVTTASRYQAGWQSNYSYSPRAFWFGGLRYEQDEFSGFDYQANVNTGFGYKFIDSERVRLFGQVGIGYRGLKNALTGEISHDAIASTGFIYENQLNASTKVVDKFRLESGLHNTLTSNFLGLEVKMTAKLALSIGYDVRNNSNPPGGLKKTDTLTTTNLVFAF